MWWLVVGMVVAFVMFVVYDHAICAERKKVDQVREAMQIENDLLRETIKNLEIEKAYHAGYKDGRNDPKRDVEVLAETLTQTGNGVVRFGRK